MNKVGVGGLSSSWSQGSRGERFYPDFTEVVERLETGWSS